VTAETYLRCEREGPVAILIYDRPHRRHAWDAGMYRAIVAAITAVLMARYDERIGDGVAFNVDKMPQCPL
jgi:enoyl-CoA hydratase/carnithine racemase